MNLNFIDGTNGDNTTMEFMKLKDGIFRFMEEDSKLKLDPETLFVEIRPSIFVAYCFVRKARYYRRRIGQKYGVFYRKHDDSPLEKEYLIIPKDASVKSKAETVKSTKNNSQTHPMMMNKATNGLPCSDCPHPASDNPIPCVGEEGDDWQVITCKLSNGRECVRVKMLPTCGCGL